MQPVIIPSHNSPKWNEIIERFPSADVCHLAEYHQAYVTREHNCQALLWYISLGDMELCYPFILNEVGGKSKAILKSYTGYYDITSVYGYSGPLINHYDEQLCVTAWSVFFEWAIEKGVIAEFIRFSPYSKNWLNCRKGIAIQENRLLAVSDLTCNEDHLFDQLGAKTRNMIRKAERNEIEFKELEVREWQEAFIQLYHHSMHRNSASQFFYYDDKYFNHLLKLDKSKFRLVGAFVSGEMVGAINLLAHNQYALYHLGAIDPAFAHLGVGNFLLWHTSILLKKSGIKIFNLGGGRTTEVNDPLLRFKKHNSNGLKPFHIGMGVLNREVYESIKADWFAANTSRSTSTNLIFYR